MKANEQSIGIRGMARLQIIDKKTKKIVGDSGWRKNVLTNYGFNCCLGAAPIGAANSVQVAGLVLGSGSDACASSATVLDGINTKQYSSVAQSSMVSSLTAQLSQVFDGAQDSMAKIMNIGVQNGTGGSLIAGLTYASSSLGTDQDVNATYRFVYTRQ